MSIDNYRTLVALRHAAESIDEVSVFLARGMETYVRLRKQNAWDRIGLYFAGTATAIVSAFSFDSRWFAPGITLAAFLLIMFGRAIFVLISIENQRKELLVDHESVKDYLRNATRDRLENGISLAIQNRSAATRLLREGGISDDDQAYLERSEAFWADRVLRFRARLQATDSNVWMGHEEMHERLSRWIDDELEPRPPSKA